MNASAQAVTGWERQFPDSQVHAHAAEASQLLQAGTGQLQGTQQGLRSMPAGIRGRNATCRLCCLCASVFTVFTDRALCVVSARLLKHKGTEERRGKVC